MNIDWLHFTPWTSLGGGILLGIASAMFVLLNGRILGISGILGGLLAPRMGDIGWRFAFLLGMGAAARISSRARLSWPVLRRVAWAWPARALMFWAARRGG